MEVWAEVWVPLPFQPLRVRGCILTLVERMDEEFTKIMQNTDPHSQGELEQAWAPVRGNVQELKLRVTLNKHMESQFFPRAFTRGPEILGLSPISSDSVGLRDLKFAFLTCFQVVLLV